MNRTDKVIKAHSQVLQKTHTSPSLQDKFAKCDLEVKKHIAKLEMEISPLQTKNTELQAQNLALNKRVRLLIKDIAEYEFKAMSPEE